MPVRHGGDPIGLRRSSGLGRGGGLKEETIEGCNTSSDKRRRVGESPCVIGLGFSHGGQERKAKPREGPLFRPVWRGARGGGITDV